jgi:hypothetical protein
MVEATPGASTSEVTPGISTLGGRPPTVIYVMGAGRSGSTLLGVALGNCADVFYAGELEDWLKRSGVPNFGGAERTGFWDSVRRQVGGEELFGDEPWRKLEYSLSLLRVHEWVARRRLRPRYRRTTERLYGAIASRAHAAHIVDTSHYPLRARELQRLGGVNLYLVYLIRDPRNVVASFGRRDLTNVAKSTLATNAYLCLTHLLSVFVFLRHRADRRLLLRYEDLIAEPEHVLRQILGWIGSDAALPDLACLTTGIPFQGNRFLDSEVIALRSGPTATSRPRGSWITRVFQLPWAIILPRIGPKAGTSAPGE